ncbi:tRNA pseudouridine(38/39) synthase [Thelohanellus kitauei]|uniref:tRNA pseudouridine synthase n=1 Tax=Thelohanellus kitauei TaxID=669202 RepID=A0A0C2MQU7_THEKT|nr:tRNA pseudouridine(38/39) synthase [Thelohanellus kitauei]
MDPANKGSDEYKKLMDKPKHVGKIGYLGWNYHGLAFQPGTNTVEDEIFKAFIKLKLLKSPISQSRYSKCGRTDAGVSASCQVVSCFLRSNVLKQNELTQEEICEKHKALYLRSLNSALPWDITVLAYSFVGPDFDARKSCLSRTYKYFLPSKGVDFELLQQSSKYFVGKHDFRNFCKVSKSNPLKSFVREIQDISVDSSDSQTFAITIKANSFLYNQIRCMLYVLLMVACKYEDPKVILNLLDVDKTPDKPDYDILSGIPLVLCNCEFTDVDWVLSENDSKLLQKEYVIDLSKINVIETLKSAHMAAPSEYLDSPKIDIPSLSLVSDFQNMYIKIMDRPKNRMFSHFRGKRSETIRKMLNNET